MGTLYVVATPIGNLGDISERALQTLENVSLIAAEDTRHSGKMLAHFGIRTPTLSYHTFNERARRDHLLEALAGGDVALVSDAGTPAIADPGQDLVAAAIAAGFTVTPIPGASSLTAAVSASGLIDGPFLTLGFLPRKGKERATVLAKAAATGYPIVIFEAPSRVLRTLEDLRKAFGNRDALVARELTKLHEDLRWGKLSDLSTHYTSKQPRGEFVIVVAGDNMVAPSESASGAKRIVRNLVLAGLKPSQVAREAAVMTGRPKSELYELAVKVRSEQP